MTASTLTASTLEVTHEYLAAWQRKDADAIAAHVHTHVHFKGPMTELQGREPFIAACKRMFPMLKEYRVRSVAATEDRAIFVYDFVCVEPIGLCRTAELITVKDGLIRDVELFFDARPFEKLASVKAAQK